MDLITVSAYNVSIDHLTHSIETIIAMPPGEEQTDAYANWLDEIENVYEFLNDISSEIELWIEDQPETFDVSDQADEQFIQHMQAWQVKLKKAMVHMDDINQVAIEVNWLRKTIAILKDLALSMPRKL